ncbi:hypothetical protein [Candidatus Uabimicrobium amorphum]|uniref:RanBP2-type domain-containing protein n=1 Tax=Uabimicrobium amorphum TaxID=2596890 RepID=A0A5S9IRJ7_UABAM|nr:hypothetical protein [Candidatus Uabimicrobium amorphum]BBM86306.1 hypothetical protein UABAM_04692 [Candidatus Uabimicrobium amorphum]
MSNQKIWKCGKCGEEHEYTFDTCWNCGGSIANKQEDQTVSKKLDIMDENKPEYNESIGFENSSESTIEDSHLSPIELESDYTTYSAFIPTKSLFGPVVRYPFWGFFGQVRLMVIDEGVVITGQKMRSGFIFHSLSLAFIIAMFLLLALKVIGHLWVFVIAVSGAKAIEIIRQTHSEITIPFNSFLDISGKGVKKLRTVVQIRRRKVSQILIFDSEGHAADFRNRICNPGAAPANKKTWKCEKCGEEHEYTFDACWNCGKGISENGKTNSL